MSEIKFRAWEAMEKRFFSWDEVQENTIQDVFRLFDCQQFTGLIDRNGREIYEGDIIDMRYDTDPTDEHLYVLVEYHDAAFWVGAVLLLEDYDEVRGVVGNIYANPELLTK